MVRSSVVGWLGVAIAVTLLVVGLVSAVKESYWTSSDAVDAEPLRIGSCAFSDTDLGIKQIHCQDPRAALQVLGEENPEVNSSDSIVPGCPARTLFVAVSVITIGGRESGGTGEPPLCMGPIER